MADYLTTGQAQQHGGTGKFVGREEEQRKFVSALQRTLKLEKKPGNQDILYPHIFQIAGIGGIGKSTLTHQLLAIAETHDVETVYLDAEEFTITDPDIFMHVLYRQLRDKLGKGHVERFFETYRESIEKRPETRQKVAEAQDRFAALVEVSAELLSGAFPGLVAPVIKEAIEVSTHSGAKALYNTRQRFQSWVREQGVLKEDEWLEAVNPFSLTRVFMKGLNNLSERKPLVIALDTYEKLTEHDPWLVKALTWNPPRVLWIISGRESDELLRRYRDQHGAILEQMQLDVFDTQEIRDYLELHGVQTDALSAHQGLLDSVQSVSRGIPLAVEALVNFRAQGMDVAKEFANMVAQPQSQYDVIALLTDRLLKWSNPATVQSAEEAAQREIDRRWLLGLALLGRIDPIEVQAIGSVIETEFDADELLRGLGRRHSFAFDRNGDLHDQVREVLREWLRQRPLTAWLTGLARSAHDYFEGIVHTIQSDMQPSGYCSELAWLQAAQRLIDASGWLDRNGRETIRVFLPLAIRTHFYNRGAIRALNGALFGCQFSDVRYRQLQSLWDKYGYSSVSHVSTKEMMAQATDRIVEEIRQGEKRNIAVFLSIGASTIPETEQLWRAVADLTQHYTQPPDVQAIIFVYLARLEQVNRKFNGAVDLYWNAVQLAEEIPIDFKAELGNEIADFLIRVQNSQKNQTNIIVERLGKIAEAATQMAPKNKKAWLAYSLILDWMGDHDTALANLELVDALEPQNVEADLFRGKIYTTLGQYSKAVDCLKRAIAHEPGFSMTYTNLGHALEQLGYYNEAITYHDQAIVLDPDDPIPHNNRGATLNALNRYDEALESFGRALECGIDRDDRAVVHANRGVALNALGRYDEAAQAFKLAVQDNPDYSLAYLNLGDAQLALKQYNEALSSYERAAQLDPENASAHNNQGVALFRLNQYDRALISYNRAVSLDPTDVAAQDNLGQLLIRLARYEEAVNAFHRVWELDSNRLDALVNQSQAFTALGRHEEALAAIERVLAYTPEDAKLHYQRGQSLRLVGQNQAAEESFQRALEINSEYLSCHIALAGLYQEIDEIERYAEHVAQAQILLREGNHSAHARLASIRHEPAEALAALSEAIKKRPDQAAYARIHPDLAWLRREYAEEFARIVDKS